MHDDDPAAVPFDPERDLRLERQMAATPEAVWRCWTEPDLICRWFTPKPVETVRAEIVAAPGGAFRTVMRIPDQGEMEGTGCVLVAEPARRLVWTSALAPGFRPVPPPEPGAFVFSADVRMQAVEGGCAYEAIVRHLAPEDAQAHEAMGFSTGWGTAAAQLEEVARGL